MGEARFNPASTTRLKPISDGFHRFGHGQQLAAKRLDQRRKVVEQRAFNGPVEHQNQPGETNRQLAARLRAEVQATTNDTTAKAARKPRGAKKAAA